MKKPKQLINKSIQLLRSYYVKKIKHNRKRIAIGVGSIVICMLVIFGGVHIIQNVNYNKALKKLII